MNIRFQMNAENVNAFLSDAIKAYFTGKEIEISIKECSHRTSKIIYEPSPINKSTQQFISLLNVQRIAPIDDQVKKILKFIHIFEVKKLLYLGLGLRNIIEPIANKNIDTSVVGGEISQIAGENFFWDEEEFPGFKPPEYPNWSQDLPLSFPQEEVPHATMWIVDALNCLEKSYIEHCLNKDGSDDDFNALPQFLVVMNNLDIAHFSCYNAYFWLELGSIKIGFLDKSHYCISVDHCAMIEKEL